MAATSINLSARQTRACNEAGQGYLRVADIAAEYAGDFPFTVDEDFKLFVTITKTAKFDIGNLEWALTKAGANLQAEVPPRALVAGGSPARRRNVSEILRAAGVRAAASSDKDAKTVRQFAKAWKYDLLLRLEGKGAKATRLRDGRSRTVSLDAGAISELKTWVVPASE